MQISATPEKVVQEKPDQFSQAIYYPESDGKPMGETSVHIAAILYLLGALQAYFRHVPDFYTAANMLFYYEEGEPTIYKVPDVFVVKGMPKHERRVYKLWEEKVMPQIIFEITSRSTRWEDTGEKKGLYAELGVREYFLFDPQGEYLKPQLQGFRLVQAAYQPMPAAQDGTLTSEELGLLLRPDGNLLRLVDPGTGRPVPTLGEAIASREAAEAELARMRDELERVKRLAGLH